MPTTYPSLLGLDNLSISANGEIAFAGATFSSRRDRILENRTILLNWWDGGVPARPIVLVQPSTGPELRMVTEMIGDQSVSYLVHEPRIVSQLAENLRLLDAGFTILPCVSSDFNTLLVPSAFGQPMIIPEGATSGGSMWTVPQYETLDRMAALEAPDLQAGFVGHCLAETLLLRERLPEEIAVGVRMNDGPMSIACHLCGMENLLVALCDAPDIAHHVLDVVTDAWISIRSGIEQAADYARYRPGEVHADVPVHAPCVGAMICDDSMIVLSPAQYEAFLLPYHQRILQRFGGGIVHSCGNIMHLVPILASLPELGGVEFGQGELNDLPQARTVLGEKIMVCWAWPDIISENSARESITALLAQPRTALYSGNIEILAACLVVCP